jgi:hypothetical protein
VYICLRRRTQCTDIASIERHALEFCRLAQRFFIRRSDGNRIASRASNRKSASKQNSHTKPHTEIARASSAGK